MILRLAANAAVHAVGGAVMGVTVVMAACTLAQTAARGFKRSGAAPGPANPRSGGGRNDPA
ncbi:hypothetical protein SAMN05444370_1478 [Rubrimonas cliftonensis]|uniref:Lipoprotein n=1 Tax=Rubrimonas cliftonensis TaxID=89524 RepID=A0A1H4GAV5_9RHOB|nr:hypothetical protein SAMN05444370_1478 [Rubrimonas cliftonensis]